MGTPQILLIALLLVSTLQSDPSSSQVGYLIQANEPLRAIDCYLERKRELGSHDFELLRQLSTLLLEQGVRSSDPETELLSLYGASITGLSSILPVLEEGIKSPNPQIQILAIHLLANLQDDHGTQAIVRAMSSPYLPIRMEAGYYLAQIKHRKAAGHLEALMNRMPPLFRVYFPAFFATIGSKEATSILKELMEDPLPQVRAEAIVQAAAFHRDDLLPKIRSSATHHEAAVLEASLFALGLLKDSKSIPLLKKELARGEAHTQLAAAFALHRLGQKEGSAFIEARGREGSLFAIAMLGSISSSEEVLAKLLEGPDKNVRLNSALALLERRDTRCLPLIEELLLNPDFNLYPHFSPGGTQRLWKVHSVPLNRREMAAFFELKAQVLRQCLELKEQAFLPLARKILDSNRLELVPLTVALLENHRSERAISLLKEKSERVGAPLVRATCNLALYRMQEKGPYKERVVAWVKKEKHREAIQFQEPADFEERYRLHTAYELTPEEGGELLIQSYQTLSDQLDPEAIDLLLEAMREGNPKNRYLLAGILLYAVQ